jgi:predicted NBD/HSP70 family sugar kinase
LQLGPVLNRIKTLAAKGNPEAQRAYRQAGYRLGNGICQINQLLAPTRVLLAGETGSQPDFVAGVMERLAEESNQPVLTVSHVKSISAAGAVALETHLFSSNTTLTLGEAA